MAKNQGGNEGNVYRQKETPHEILRKGAVWAIFHLIFYVGLCT
jgi:hypothetical protein